VVKSIEACAMAWHGRTRSEHGDGRIVQQNGHEKWGNPLWKPWPIEIDGLPMKNGDFLELC
jgi:hypothetical protein